MSYQFVQNQAHAQIIAFAKANPDTKRIIADRHWECCVLAALGYTKKERQFYNGGDYCDAVAGDERNLRAVRRYFGLHSLVSWATINRAVDSIRYDLTEEKKQKKRQKKKKRKHRDR